MSLTFHCPSCRSWLQAPENAAGNEVTCSLCKTRIVLATPAAPNAAPSPSVTPPTPSAPIRFTCPTCHAALQHDRPGDKLLCPGCGQKLQVPAPPANKTVLGTWIAAPPPAPSLPVPAPVFELRDQGAEDLPRRRRRGFRCPYCATDDYPRSRRQVSLGGWVVFAALLLVCFPLCFLGLFITEEYDVCRYCGMRLGGARDTSSFPQACAWVLLLLVVGFVALVVISAASQ